jgi:hypothetical protein
LVLLAMPLKTKLRVLIIEVKLVWDLKYLLIYVDYTVLTQQYGGMKGCVKRGG